MKSCKVFSLGASLMYGFEKELVVMSFAGTMHSPDTHVHLGNPLCPPNEVVAMAIMNTIHAIGVKLKF